MAGWSVTPYRLVVFATGTERKGKRTKTVGYAFMGWTAHQSPFYHEARLPDAGSFLYPGFLRAREAAMEYLAQPEVHQLAIKTDQDHTVYRYFKHADGRITGYGDMD